MEEIGFPALLILLQQGNEGEVGLIGIDGVEGCQEVFYLLIVGVLDGEEEDQFQFQVVLHSIILDYLPNSLYIILPVILANQILLDA